MDKLHLVMPMGGRGSRFSQYGFEFPKPLIEINNKPFFYWATKSISKYVELASLDFVILQEHVDKFDLKQRILSYFPEANIHIIKDVLDGAVLTCLEGIKDITDGQPILFNDCDHLFLSSSFNRFCEAGDFSIFDGALLTFKSDEPIYSFVQYNESGFVIKTVEKEVISDDAICGAYYFKNTDIFKEAVSIYLDTCQYKEYFVSGVYNVLAEKGKIIKSFDTDYHIPYGVPEEYDIAKNTDKFADLQ